MINEFDMLIKLLRMTESSYDGEVLNAIHAANAILSKHNINWEELFNELFRQIEQSKITTSINKKKSHKIYTDKHEIDNYFTLVYSRNNLGSFIDYVNSVHEQWLLFNYLTEKQCNIIKDASIRR